MYSIRHIANISCALKGEPSSTCAAGVIICAICETTRVLTLLSWYYTLLAHFEELARNWPERVPPTADQYRAIESCPVKLLAVQYGPATLWPREGDCFQPDFCALHLEVVQSCNEMPHCAALIRPVPLSPLWGLANLPLCS